MKKSDSKKLTFAELKKLSIQELKKVPFDRLLELTDDQWDELLKNEKISLHYEGINLGNHVVYAACWYTCDTTSGAGDSC